MKSKGFVMRPLPPAQFDLPLFWNPEQAFTVIDFLEDIIAAIWALHGEAIFDAKKQQLARTNSAHVPDDDLPF
jgi:hypothetical protein